MEGRGEVSAPGDKGRLFVGLVACAVRPSYHATRHAWQSACPLPAKSPWLVWLTRPLSHYCFSPHFKLICRKLVSEKKGALLVVILTCHIIIASLCKAHRNATYQKLSFVCDPIGLLGTLLDRMTHIISNKLSRCKYRRYYRAENFRGDNSIDSLLG